MTPTINYCGFFDSFSGMGEAARNIVMALNSAKVNVTTEFISNYTGFKLGTEHELVTSLKAKYMDYKIKIMHLTPDLVTQYMEPMKYHIFHLFWETDNLPRWWVWALNLCDEIWTGDNFHAEIFKKAGVKKPIFVFPQPIDNKTDYTPYQTIVGFPKQGTFWFYSIFQWIERKDPKSLIQAYLKEFEGEKKVGLIIKSYKEKFNTEETENMRKDIFKWKGELNLKTYPKIYFCPDLLSKKDVRRIHATGDCFVLPHRGEGWCRPAQEALMIGKPIIATKLGGIFECLPDNCGYFPKHTETNVFNMDWVPWYGKDQKWGQVDVNDLRAKMRFAFEHQDEAKETGVRGAEFVKREMNFKVAGEKMARRLEEIYQKI